MDPPSGRVPKQGPDWFLVATEACGGGTPELGYFLGVSIFIGIFGVGFTPGGSPSRPRDRGPRPGGWARPPPLWTAPDSSGPTLLLWGIVLRYVTAPMVELGFVLVLYLLPFFAAKVTQFLSLHVKFIWSK